MNTHLIEWVKVEDKLPGIGEEVLIYEDGEITSASLCDNMQKIIFSKEETSMFETWKYFNNVTHWAYFPDPPNDIDL